MNRGVVFFLVEGVISVYVGLYCIFYGAANGTFGKPGQWDIWVMTYWPRIIVGLEVSQVENQCIRPFFKKNSLLKRIQNCIILFYNMHLTLFVGVTKLHKIISWTFWNPCLTGVMDCKDSIFVSVETSRIFLAHNWFILHHRFIIACLSWEGYKII